MTAPTQDFGEQFEALCIDAQAAKDEAVARIRDLLGEADDLLEGLRGKGLSIRCELPMGTGASLSDMRFLADFGRRLT